MLPEWSQDSQSGSAQGKNSLKWMNEIPLKFRFIFFRSSHRNMSLTDAGGESLRCDLLSGWRSCRRKGEHTILDGTVGFLVA